MIAGVMNYKLQKKPTFYAPAMIDRGILFFVQFVHLSLSVYFYFAITFEP